MDSFYKHIVLAFISVLLVTFSLVGALNIIEQQRTIQRRLIARYEDQYMTVKLINNEEDPEVMMGEDADGNVYYLTVADQSKVSE